VLHAVEGWGKTSLAAKAPKPIFVQSRGETGLETLVQAGMLPETPRFPECKSWRDILDAVDVLTEEDHPYKTFVLDTGNGAERLCHEAVCVRDFGNDWGEKGFLSYGKGPEVSVADWLLLLQKLDKLRETKRMTIFVLFHTRVTGFKNPEGADYDRYQPEMHKTTWAATAKWADAILFGNFETVVDTKRKSDAKGKGTIKRRVLYTERSAAFDAKNRMGLPIEIDMGDSPDEAWGNLSGALKEARAARTAPAPEATNTGAQTDGQ
jgi:hypothetical protein